MPIQKGCRVKVIYPSDYRITNRLTSMDGSGFFAPIGGSVEFKVNPESNSFEVIACKQNFGQFTSGILTIQQVLNQDYVHNSGTFKIFMTEEKDIEFAKVSQSITSGFIIPEEQ